MSESTSGHVLTGYIPEKFGDRLVHIDAAHPLASRLVASLTPARTRPVIIIEGGEYDGQVVDLNDCALDYAMAQLGAYDYVDGEPPRIVVREHASSEPVVDPVLASLPDAIVVPTPDALPGTAPEGTATPIVGEQPPAEQPAATPMKTAEQSTTHETPAPATRAGSKRGR